MALAAIRKTVRAPRSIPLPGPIDAERAVAVTVAIGLVGGTVVQWEQGDPKVDDKSADSRLFRAR